MTSFKDVKIAQGDGLYLRLKEGVTRIRIVSEPVAVWKAFNGSECTVYATEEDARYDKKARERYYMWVIDRTDGGVKILEGGASIMGQLNAFACDEDFGFDTIPPYDIKITREGTMLDTEYKLMTAPATPLTDAEKDLVRAKIAEKGSLESIIRKDAEKTPKTHAPSDIDVSSIPF